MSASLRRDLGVNRVRSGGWCAPEGYFDGREGVLRLAINHPGVEKVEARL